MGAYEQFGRQLAEPPIHVVIVDDDPSHRLLVEEVLAPPRYQVRSAADGAGGLATLQDGPADVVLVDRCMPGMSGDEFCRRIRQQLGLPMLPVLMVTGAAGPQDLAHALASGADDFVRKPYLPLELRARVDAAAQRKRFTDQLDCTESTLYALARMVEAKDGTTGDHCGRLARHAVRLGAALGLSAPELRALERGGVLHDIGKIGIPDAILLKPGRLDAQEWEVMRTHTTIGHDLVAPLKSMRLTAPIVRHHHERWDGSGYPDRLAGEHIPLLARVFQIVDIYDALVHERPYKAAMSPAEACAVIELETARGWYDPRIVREFTALLRREPDALASDGPP